MLQETGIVRHAFIGRIPGINVATDRAQALVRLEDVHQTIRAELGFNTLPFASAEQVHGNLLAVIDQPLQHNCCFAGADGLLTNQSGVSLGIYVADCCAVFLVDPVKRAIGLVHSGRKGTELEIVKHAILRMSARFGSSASDLILQLSPCIRPPHYEVDFAADIVKQAKAAGVMQVHDSGLCTACDLARYYSYRAEKGRTGRMLALLSLMERSD